MGYCKQLMFLCITLVTATTSFWAPLHHVTPPQVDIKWWGHGEPRLLDETVRNFKINISQEVTNTLFREDININKFAVYIQLYIYNGFT